MNKTYRQLRDALNKLPDENLDDNVTVLLAYDVDEYMPIKSFQFADAENGILDEGHFFLVTPD